MGIMVEISGMIVDDSAWLRKKDDCGHINVAELDAALKGINLAMKWGLREIEFRTDLATVVGWLKLVIYIEKRVKTKGAGEMIIKC